MNLEGIGSSGKKGVVKPYGCKDCGETNPINFYKGQKIRCKKCHSKVTHQRAKEIKQQGVDYLGGKCVRCGYDKYVGALQFHHINPAEKDIKKFAKFNSFTILKEELDKCILLCANCHAEEHANWTGG